MASQSTKLYRGAYCGNPSLKNEESFSIRCPKQRNVVFDAMLSKYSWQSC